MNYFIAVHTPALCPIGDLAAALRAAYDGGTDGYFRILPAKANQFTVIFERDAYADAGYVAKRAEDDHTSVEAAAMRQLGAELKDGGVGEVATDIADALLAADATVFDFENGALEFLATFEPEYCDCCGDELEIGQIGLCDVCQEAADVDKSSNNCKTGCQKDTTP